MIRFVQTDYIKEAEEEEHGVEDDIDGFSSSYSFLSVRTFIKYQTNSIFYDNHKYMCNPLTHNDYSSKFLGETSFIDAQKEPLRLLNIVVAISVHLEYFDLKHHYNNKIKYMKIFIFSTYLICWSYILIVSLPMLPLNAFDWLWIIQDSIEPFSLTTL